MKFTTIFLTVLAAVASVEAKKKSGGGGGDDEGAGANVQVAQYGVIGAAAGAALWAYLI
jgi:hypothetical protein